MSNAYCLAVHETRTIIQPLKNQRYNVRMERGKGRGERREGKGERGEIEG